MTTGGRIWTGAGMGILGATLGYTAMLAGRTDLSHLLLALPEIFLIMLLSAGPGALVLSVLHASLMGRWAPRASSRGQIRIVGILLGMFLGVANLIVSFEALLLAWGGGHRTNVYSPQMALLLIPAVAGGAGAGWGVTLGLNPGLPEDR